MGKKLYSVNVHYDVVINVDVCADNEDDAIEKAEDKAQDISLTKAEVVGVKSCIVDVQ